MSDTPPDLTPEQVSPEPAPKKRIIRKTKSAAEAPVKPQTAAEVPGTEQDSSPAPRKRTIRKKVAELADDGMESVDMPGKKTSRKSSAEIPVEEAQDVPARPRRGRPRKKPVEEVPETDGSAIVSGTEAAVKPVRRRAAKAVAPENGDSAGPEAEIAVHAAPAEPASDSSDSVPEQPAEGRPKVIRQRFVRKPREQEPEADASVPSIKVVQEGAADFSEDAAREPRRTNEPQRQRFDRQNRRNNNDRFNKAMTDISKIAIAIIVRSYNFSHYKTIVDIGGGTTEIGVTSLGGLVLCKSVKVGGDKIDRSIIEYVRQNYNLFIGERTAETVKIEVGAAIKLDPELKIQIKGKDHSGYLSTIELGSEGIRIAIKEPLKEIASAIRSVLENMPPDLAGDVVDNGIIITGGGALIRGLDKYLTEIVKIPVRIADEPLLSVAYGTSQVLDEPGLLKIIEDMKNS